MMTDTPAPCRVRSPVPPAAVPPPFDPHRPVRWKRVAVIVAAALVALLVVLVVVVVIIVHRLNTPATVPASWRPPTALPRSAAVGVPAGNLVFDSNRTGNYEIWTMGPTGAGARELTHDVDLRLVVGPPLPRSAHDPLLPDTQGHPRPRLLEDLPVGHGGGRQRSGRAPPGRPRRLGAAGPCRVVAGRHAARDVRGRPLQPPDRDHRRARPASPAR